MTKQQEIFTRAWKIAREAAKKFGGKPSEYIQGGAVKQAVEEVDESGKIINSVLTKIQEGLSYTTPKSTIGGEIFVRHNSERLFDIITDSIEKWGRIETAQRLLKLWGDKISDWIDRILYAVYDSEYALWGSGGRAAFEAVLSELASALEVEDLEGELYRS